METRLIEQHHGWVLTWAMRYAERYGAELDDLVQCGRVGIVKARRRYRDDRGANFLTYATWWIKREMRHWVYRNLALVRVPPKKFFSHAVQVVSLESPVHPQEPLGLTLQDVLGQEEAEEVAPGLELELARARIEKLMAGLTSREREVVVGRYWEGKSQRQLGAALGVTFQRIGQIETRALRRMRQWAREEELQRGKKVISDQ